MRVQAVAPTFSRWPDAEAMEVDGRWMVSAGSKNRAEVMPRGVHQAAGWGNQPESLPMSLHELHEELREVAVYEPAEAAARLAQLCRSAPVPELCVHGLAPHHIGTGKGRGCRMPRAGGFRAIAVDHMQLMVSGLDGVRSLAQHLAKQRKPATPRLAMNALLWPVLSGSGGPELVDGSEGTICEPVPDGPLVRSIRAELEREGHLRQVRAKQIVTLTMKLALSQAAVVLNFEWSRNHRPEMVLEVHTELGAYLVDFTRHVTDATALRTEDVDRSVTCAVCDQPFTPRRRSPGGDYYCTRPECQRERQRRNQERSRARRRKSNEEAAQ